MRPFAWPAGRRCGLSLSFDDGRPSQVDRGVPLLNEYGVKATFFVVMRQVPQRGQAWRRAAADGHELGNHTVTHPCSGNFSWSRDNALEDYDLPRIERELTQANAEIEAFHGQRPSSFAYCCGQTFVGRGEGRQSYVPVVARLFQVGRGFRTENPNDPAFVDLAHVGGRDADRATAADMIAWIDEACAQGHWLVLVGHDLNDVGGQAVIVRELDAVLRSLRGRDEVWVDTVGAIGAYIAASRAVPA
jgi:peptidoglycan/xylan/chitin deacetylase (PgdA/CDA1 family)